MSTRIRREVRSLHPDYVAVLTNIVLNVARSKREGNIHLYKEDLDSLWKILPPDAQANARRLLSSQLGFDVESVDDVVSYARSKCESEFDEHTHPLKIELKCNTIVKHVLDIVFEILMKVAHNHGLFIAHRFVETGREA